MRFAYVILLLSIAQLGYSQADSTTLSYNEFIELVIEQHPIAIQARLQTEMGAANLQSARGGFDPKIEAGLDQKYFKDQEYYDLGEGKLKIPTWFGVELEGGYERNQGDFLNPENNVPNAGLLFAGISVPIGEGLFIDERRATLRKAQIMVEQSEADRDLILNDLLFKAGSTYWDWFNAYYDLKVYEQALSLARERFNAVKLSARLGDSPTIDTLEAGIQVQTRQLNLQQAQLNYKNATAMLSVYLWQNGVVPLELQPNITPNSKENIQLEIEQFRLTYQQDSFLITHPELRRSIANIRQLEIDRRWGREQLKPTLNLKYKPITEASEENPFAEYSINNYTWGFQFEFPIFLRKERGKLNLINLKINEKNLDLENKRQSITTKVEMANNEFETTRQQIQLFQKTTQDYKGLLDGEIRLFDGGESSLFMVNSREQGYIKAQLKLNELITKNKKAILKTRYALGTLNTTN